VSDAAERLAPLEDHPEYARAMRHEPKSFTALIVVLGISLTVGGGVMGVIATSSSMRTFGWCLALGGVVCLAVSVFFITTPLERVLAEVVGERTEQERVRERGRMDRTSKRHYTVLARQDGVTREYRADRELNERLQPGDTGVAYLKAGFLLDFRPLR
jgi:hypothetical protein